MYLCGACIILYVSFTNKILIPHEEHGPKEWQINLPEGSFSHVAWNKNNNIWKYGITGQLALSSLLSLLFLLSLRTKLLLSSNLIQTIISNFRIRVANQITWLETKNSSIPLVATKDLLLFGKKNRKFFQIFSFIILLIFWYFQYYFHELKITMQLARLFQNFLKIFLSMQFLIWKL